MFLQHHVPGYFFGRIKTLGVSVAFVVISILCMFAVYLQALSTGMPIKRWLGLALFTGPAAWYYFECTTVELGCVAVPI